MWQWWAVGSGFEFGHGRWGSLLAGGLGLDVAVGFCLGGGGVFRHRQWVGRDGRRWAAIVFSLRFLFSVLRLDEIGFNLVYSRAYF
jgi:hypothetical protein